jgi:hemoglobin
MAAAKKESLYERVGGEKGVAKLVDRFYERVLDDPELAPFFEHSSMDKLRLMQREFIAAALGGPAKYTGRPIAEAHQSRGIRVAHVKRFLDHLLAVLEDFDLSQDEVLDIHGRIGTYLDEVTGGSAVAG